MDLLKNALEVLKETSRTFYIPISALPEGLIEAVTSAYLCMRAIDEVEDHPSLEKTNKVQILSKISCNLQALRVGGLNNKLSQDLEEYSEVLPEVTLRIGEWALLASETISPRIWESTATMADRMAYWSKRDWQINNEADLDQYIFSVAGAVGILLSDLWSWYDGTSTNRTHAIGFGAGLQAVNIIRNYKEDLDRGVSFVPPNWNREDMNQYARRNLKLADQYIGSLSSGPVLNFCKIPLLLAYATLDAIDAGKEKLSREDVQNLIKQT